MKSPILLLLASLISISCDPGISSQEIINQSIRFHDPQNEWPEFQYELTIDEYRPNGMIRQTMATFDLPFCAYSINREGQYTFQVLGEQVRIDSGEISPERAITIRDYYLYLWGLPMKLADPGTKVGNWQSSHWDGRQSIEVPVYYDKDTWFFHFDPDSYQMIGYKFYSDTTQAKGETIMLEGLTSVSNMKIPTERSWFQIPENEYLGKDVLIGSKKH